MFFKYFSRQTLFSRTFQDCPVFSSTFQARVKGAQWLSGRVLHLETEGPRVQASQASLRSGP